MTPKQRHGLSIAAILLAGAAAYGLSLKDGFVWDDGFQIVRNPFLRAGTAWHNLLTMDVWGYTRPDSGGMSNYYRPLQMLTYRLIEQWAGLKPAVFHGVSLGVHLLACVLVYAILYELTKRWSWATAGALLFAVHPMHAEAVIWISALTETGCALFYFLAFWLFLRAQRRARGWERTWRIGVSVLLFLVAVFWKEMALTLPGIVGAWVICFAEASESWGKRLRHAVLYSLPYGAAIGLYLVVRIKVLGYFSRVQQAWALTRTSYVLTDIYFLAKYWTKLLLPVKLNAFYVFHPVNRIAEPRELAAIVFLAVSAALILWGIKRAPVASFAAAWTFLTLVPVLALRQLGMNVFTERYLYIPSLGFCLLLVWAGSEAIRRWKPRQISANWAGATAVVVVMALYVTQDLRRIPDWKSDATLYATTVKASPDSAFMHNSYGQVLGDARDYAGAEQQYLLAIAEGSAAQPPQPFQVADGYVGLAGVDTARGQYDQALDAAERAMKLAPGWFGAKVAAAVVLMHLGRPIEARQLLLLASKSNPNDEVVVNALGVVALTLHDESSAQLYFRRALVIDPNYAAGWSNLGRAEAEAGQLAQAIPDLERAVHLEPTNAVFRTNLAAALARLGRYDEALAETEKALALDPSYAPAQHNLTLLQQLQKAGAPADGKR